MVDLHPDPSVHAAVRRSTPTSGPIVCNHQSFVLDIALHWIPTRRAKSLLCYGLPRATTGTVTVQYGATLRLVKPTFRLSLEEFIRIVFAHVPCRYLRGTAKGVSVEKASRCLGSFLSEDRVLCRSFRRMQNLRLGLRRSVVVQLVWMGLLSKRATGRSDISFPLPPR